MALLLIALIGLNLLIMTANICRAVRLYIRGEDWRLPAYEVIGQLLATVVCLAVGFLIITR